MSIMDKFFYGKFQFGLLERLIVLENLIDNAERMNYTSVSVIRKLYDFNEKAIIMRNISDNIDVLLTKSHYELS